MEIITIIFAIIILLFSLFIFGADLLEAIEESAEAWRDFFRNLRSKK